MIDEKTMRFGFTHNSSDGDWSFDNYYEDGTPWPVILRDFLSFLSGVYGYDIHKKVEYETLEERLERIQEGLSKEVDW